MDQNVKRRSKKSKGASSLQLEPLETRVLLAADWQNPVNNLDVDASGEIAPVSPMDALLVINELNSPKISDPATGQLPTIGEFDDANPPYVDVDGDGLVGPLDAVQVVNALNVAAEPDGPMTSFVASSVMAGSRAAAAHGGDDDDTLVNSVTRHSQSESDIAAGPSGESWVVWQSLAQDGSGWGVYGQRYAADGSKIGDEFQINTTTKGSQRNPKVAVADNGNVMVVWQSIGQDGSGWGVFGRVYDSAGDPVSGEVPINSTTRGAQSNPDVTVDSAGIFSVAWEGRGAGDRNGIFMSTFSADLVPGGEMLVNSSTKGNQSHPAIDAGPAGPVVVWQGKGPGDNNGVFMGNPSSAQELVNITTRGVQKSPAVSVADDGSMVVAWQSPDRGAGVFARQFAADGTGAGSEIAISQSTRGAQKGPAVAQLAEGGFVASWFGKGPADHLGVFARTFDASGVATSDDMIVNHTTRSGQTRSAIAAVNNGYAVTWQGRGTGDRRGIFARFVDSDVAGPFQIDSIPDQTINEGDTLMVTATVTDTDGVPDMPVFSLTMSPAGMTIDSATGEIQWVTDEDDGPGTFEVIVAATEGDFTDSTTFMVTVLEVGEPPVLDPVDDMIAPVGEFFSVTFTATDPDPGDTQTFTVDNADGGDLPAWLTFDAAIATLSGTPAASDVGVTTLIVTVTDGDGLSDSDTFTITVTANQPPVVVTPIPDQTVNEGDPFTLDVSSNFSDPDGDPLTYAAADVSGGGSDPLPSWLSFDPATGVFSGTPGNLDVGSLNIEVTASDPDGASVSDTFELVVVDINNNAPSITDQVFRVSPSAPNGTVVGTVVAADLDRGTTLSYSITDGNDAGGFAIDSATGEITIADDTVVVDGVTFDLTVEVSDGMLSSSAIVSIISTTDPVTVAYTLSAEDSAGNELTMVTAGDAFELVLTVQDVRAMPTGVFSAFVDIGYQTGFVSVNGDVMHTMPYDAGTSADTTTPGQIDEAGGVDGINELGGDPLEVLRVPMTVGAVPDGDVISFATNPADNMITHPTLRFGDTMELPSSEISFGTLSLNVGEPIPVVPSVAYTLVAQDSSGGTLTSVAPGDAFDLVLLVQDTRDAATGVFSAFADINYPADLLSVAGSVTHSSTYPSGTSADLGTAGLIDEAGGVDGLSELGGSVIEVLRVPMEAGLTASEVIVISTDPADDMIQHPTLRFGDSEALPSADIDFGTLTLSVTPPSAASLVAPSSSGPALQSTADSAAGSLTVPVTEIQTTPFVSSAPAAWDASHTDRYDAIRDAVFGEATDELTAGVWQEDLAELMPIL